MLYNENKYEFVTNYLKLNISFDEFCLKLKFKEEIKNNIVIKFIILEHLIIYFSQYLALYIRHAKNISFIKKGQNIIIHGTILEILDRIEYIIYSGSYGDVNFICKGLKILKGRKIKKNINKNKQVGCVNINQNINQYLDQNIFIPSNGQCFYDCLKYLLNSFSCNKQKQLIQYLINKKIGCYPITLNNIIKNLNIFNIQINLKVIKLNYFQNIKYIQRQINVKQAIIFIEFDNYYHSICTIDHKNIKYSDIKNIIENNIYYTNTDYFLISKYRKNINNSKIKIL